MSIKVSKKSLEMAVGVLTMDNAVKGEEIHNLKVEVASLRATVSRLEATVSRLEANIKLDISSGSITESCVQMKVSIREWSRRVHKKVIDEFLETTEGKYFRSQLDEKEEKELSKINYVSKLRRFIKDVLPNRSYSPYIKKLSEVEKMLGFSEVLDDFLSNNNESFGNLSAHENPLPLSYLRENAPHILTEAGESVNIKFIDSVLIALLKFYGEEKILP